ncbi:unnamed protein product [Hydatigera taeniaeformis]|uniref:CCDC66 domain-containing protein n=1 Tax=Hydatigena taeniaeformis TaxID=6205 RepID=A0A0R3X4U6_HYDTA|nr:unnamed protein product [Hydatigera taeniaeformis]
MSAKSSRVPATIGTRTRQEGFKTRKGKETTHSTATGTDVGHVSQKKLSAILGNDKQAENPLSKPPNSDSAGEFKLPKSTKVEDTSGCLENPDDSTITNKESVDEAVRRLIELNKDKLSESQLVDLIASFYLVTNQCLKKCKTDITAQIEPECIETNPKMIGEMEQESHSNEMDDGNGSAKLAVTERPISLLERKRLQWLQERAELELLERDRTRSEMDLSGKADTIGGKMQSAATRSVLSAKNYHRFQRCHYLAGLAVGEDPHTEATLKEQQRRQWLVELDRQVEERRMARERERLQNFTETADGIKEGRRAAGVERPSGTAQCDVKSVSFGRGRGLADLFEKQDSDSAAKRQQQLELQMAYAEQIRERAERRRQEREAEARREAEETARLEAERARLRQEHETELSRRREAEVTRHAAMAEAQERASKEAKVLETRLAYKKRTQGNVRRPSRSTSYVPLSSGRTSCQQGNLAGVLEKMKKQKFGSTYTISDQRKYCHLIVKQLKVSSTNYSECSIASDRADVSLQDKQCASSALPTVYTESTLPSVSFTANTAIAAALPASDFLSAITDPDFAYPQVLKSSPHLDLVTIASRDSALRQVSRIKEDRYVKDLEEACYSRRKS